MTCCPWLNVKYHLTHWSSSCWWWIITNSPRCAQRPRRKEFRIEKKGNQIEFQLSLILDAVLGL